MGIIFYTKYAINMKKDTGLVVDYECKYSKCID